MPTPHPRPKAAERAAAVAAVALAALTSAQASEGEKPIQDNSFVLEEAYNQEDGVAHHISCLSWQPKARQWSYSFTDEWPVVTPLHQLGFTLPVSRVDDGLAASVGVGDLLVNYRYQAVGSPATKVALAPRLSIALPTGDASRGLGAGHFWAELNLPTSFTLSPTLVSHWNAGVSAVVLDQTLSFSRLTFNFGQSLIWLVGNRVNLLLESLFNTYVEPSGARVNRLNLGPGVRTGFDFASGLQVVAGLAAYANVLAPDLAPTAFFYLSFEHPFLARSMPSRATP
jgi:hypothetical protein